MAVMGLMPIYQRPRTTVPNFEHRVRPLNCLIGRDHLTGLQLTQVLAWGSGMRPQRGSKPRCNKKPQEYYKDT